MATNKKSKTPPPAPPAPPRAKPPAPPRATSQARSTIPVEDEWLEPRSSRKPNATIPVSDGWVMPELPVAPKPPPLPRVEIVEKAPPHAGRAPGRRSKPPTK